MKGSEGLVLFTKVELFKIKICGGLFPFDGPFKNKNAYLQYRDQLFKVVVFLLKLTLFDDLCVFVILGVIFGKDLVLIFLDLNKILMTFRLRFTFKDYNFSRDLLTINVSYRSQRLSYFLLRLAFL